MVVIKMPSPNFNSDIVIAPVAIVLHWTAGYFMPSVNWLCNPKSEVSAHYVIDSDGFRVFSLVDTNRRAWHCNPSWHPIFEGQDIKGLNSYSVGIEIEGPPSMFGKKGWDHGMLSTLAELCREIVRENPTIKGITDHSTIAPKAKSDVLGGSGVDLFPWNDWYPNTGLENYSTPEMRAKVRKHYGME